MAKKAKENADDKVLILLDEVKRRRQEISSAQRPNWMTNLSFSYTEKPSDSIALHTVSDIKVLIRIAAFLQRLGSDYATTALLLGVDKPPKFTWQGFTYDEWLNDLKLRITKIQIAERKASLENLQQRLDKIISPELKRKLELEEIAAELEM